MLLLLGHFSRVRFCVTLRTAARQVPLSMGFSRQDYWSGLLCPSSPGDLPDLGIKPGSPALQAESLPFEPPGKPYRLYVCIVCIDHIKKSFHPSANTWVSSPSWVFWIVLLWTWMCKYLSAVLFSVLSDLYTEVLCLNHMVILLSIFWGIFLLFSVITAQFYISTSSIWGFFFPHLC